MLRREHRRDARARLRRRSDGRRKKTRQHSHGSQRPASLARPHHDRSSGTATRTRIPSREGDGGACLPLADSTLRRGPAATAATRGGSQGTENDNHQLGLGHLRDNPERSRSTTEGRAKHAHAPRGGARRVSGTAPPRRGAREPLATHSRRAGGEGPLRQETTRPTSCRQAEGGGAGSGRVPHPSPSTHHHGCRRGEGPAGGARRAVPFARNVRPSSGAA